MDFLLNLALCVLIASPLTMASSDDDSILNSPHCNYTAIYNFGDSNSDTGGISAAFYPPVLPFGKTFFHRPAGRASDGRLIIDFFAQKLGLPYLSPYLDSVATNYRRGANFATGGATIHRPKSSWFENGLSPFNLEIQVEHFIQLQDRSAYYYKQGKDEDILKRLPKPEDLARALFILDIGQNDIAAGQNNLSREAIADIVTQFISQVRILYEKGGRTFWIHNTGPIGCLPQVSSKEKDPDRQDDNGCVKRLNDVASEFNKQLKSEIEKLRQELSEAAAAIVYVDMYAAKYALISEANNQGFEEAGTICCGFHGIGYDIWCGKKGELNGTQVYADSCNDPSKVISWDGVHYTEAANGWFADRVANGSLSHRQVALTRACHGYRH